MSNGEVIGVFGGESETGDSGGELVEFGMPLILAARGITSDGTGISELERCVDSVSVRTRTVSCFGG